MNFFLFIIHLLLKTKQWASLSDMLNLTCQNLILIYFPFPMCNSRKPSHCIIPTRIETVCAASFVTE